MEERDQPQEPLAELRKSLGLPPLRDSAAHKQAVAKLREKEREEDRRSGRVTPTSHSWFWYKAEVPQRFLKWSLASSPVDEAVKAELSQAAGGQSWLLWGEHGVGKTGLAIGWLRHRMGVDELPKGTEHIVAGRFVTMPDLLSKIKATYGPDGGTAEADVMQPYREAQLLVLDDLGAEHVKGTGWLEDILYRLVGYRHDNLLPTVFTSNLSPQELGDRIGQRVMWRLVEMCGDGIVELRGRNLRA